MPCWRALQIPSFRPGKYVTSVLVPCSAQNKNEMSPRLKKPFLTGGRSSSTGSCTSSRSTGSPAEEKTRRRIEVESRIKCNWNCFIFMKHNNAIFYVQRKYRNVRNTHSHGRINVHCAYATALYLTCHSFGTSGVFLTLTRQRSVASGWNFILNRISLTCNYKKFKNFGGFSCFFRTIMLLFS